MTLLLPLASSDAVTHSSNHAQLLAAAVLGVFALVGLAGATRDCVGGLEEDRPGRGRAAWWLST